jgi:hypothetical protein
MWIVPPLTVPSGKYPVTEVPGVTPKFPKICVVGFGALWPLVTVS